MYKLIYFHTNDITTYIYRLIIDNSIENLDVKTNDPFCSSIPENQWRSSTIVRLLDESVFSDIKALASSN